MKGLKRWAVALGFALLGLLGLFGAARAGSGGDYFAGLAMFVAAVIVVMALVKQHFDGASEDRLFDVWPGRPRDNWVVLAGLAVLGLFGLFLAAGDPGAYRVGLGLAAASVWFGGYTLKHIYDLRDRAGHGRAGSRQAAHTSHGA